MNIFNSHDYPFSYPKALNLCPISDLISFPFCSLSRLVFPIRLKAALPVYSFCFMCVCFVSKRSSTGTEARGLSSEPLPAADQHNQHKWTLISDELLTEEAVVSATTLL